VNVYSFPHRSFREYLAACRLTRDTWPDELARLARSDTDRWREVTLLAAAKAARGSAANPWQLAEALCWRDPDDPRRAEKDPHGAFIAGLMLAESAKTAARTWMFQDRSAGWRGAAPSTTTKNNARCAARYDSPPEFRLHDVGFRCGVSPFL
jgi:hypothetical protein